MTRIYIVNQVLGTIAVTDALPPGRILGQLFDLGPSANNRQPPRGLCTDSLIDIAATFGGGYHRDSLAALANMPFGSYQLTALGWERV